MDAGEFFSFSPSNLFLFFAIQLLWGEMQIPVESSLRHICLGRYSTVEWTKENRWRSKIFPIWSEVDQGSSKIFPRYESSHFWI